MAGTRGRGEERVIPLKELGRELAEGERDVRGWQVQAADGTRIGRVDEVLVDAAAARIRYLDVDVARHLSPGRQPWHLLIPLAEARVSPTEETVVLERLRGDDVTNLPPYKDEPLTREYELELKDRIGDRFGPQSVEEQGFLGPQVDVDPDAHR